MRKPPLLDQLAEQAHTMTQIKGRWYIAKPIPFFGISAFFERVYHAWLVICGRAIATQYAEDMFHVEGKKYKE